MKCSRTGWLRSSRECWGAAWVSGSERVCWPLGGLRTSLSALLQTIYNAITNGTPCVIVEGSGRVADVIAQVANLPVSKITIALIQKKLSVFFHDTYELFTESKLVEWTKKVSLVQADSSTHRACGDQRGPQGSLREGKAPSVKFKAHLPPTIHHPQPCSALSWWHPKGSSSAPPLPAPFGQRGTIWDQPHLGWDTQCRESAGNPRGESNCPTQDRSLQEAAGRRCCC